MIVTVARSTRRSGPLPFRRRVGGRGHRRKKVDGVDDPDRRTTLAKLFSLDRMIGGEGQQVLVPRHQVICADGYRKVQVRLVVMVPGVVENVGNFPVEDATE